MTKVRYTGGALREGAGTALVAENALCPGTLERLSALLDAQPRWSDLPLLIYSADEEVRYPGQSSQSAAERLGERLGSSCVFTLEPPLRRATLLSAVRLALSARRRQYQVRDLLKQLDALSEFGRRMQERTTALHNSEARFSKVFYANPVPVTITTLAEGRYVDLNDRALNLLGFERAEVIGRTASELSRWERETHQTRGELLRRIQEDGSLSSVPMRFRTKAGERRDALATFEIIELGGELCLLAMIVDVTERKRDETELMQAVQEVMGDTAWFSRSFVEKLAQVRTRGAAAQQEKVDAEIKDLTRWERQVLERVAQGDNNRKIATELGLSQHTVRNYLANVFAKLDLHSRTEAVVWARTRGLGSSV